MLLLAIIGLLLIDLNYFTLHYLQLFFIISPRPLLVILSFFYYFMLLLVILAYFTLGYFWLL
jgi:hypothetical protein